MGDPTMVWKRLEQVMGERPDESRHVPLEVRVISESTAAGIVRRKLSFATEPGDRCFAWWLAPESRLAKNAGPGGAMLCLHQTTRFAKDEPVGLGGKPNLHYALELARQGHITLSPDYPNFGEYKVDCYAMGYASATMKGIWNHIRAMDLLSALPGVDPRRIGCIGHSLGAHNALFLAAFDERVRCVVSSCGFTRFTWNDNEGRGNLGDLTDWSHAGYMPRIASVYRCRAENMPFDFPDILGIIAPRPMFINAPLKDFFRHEGVRECVDLIRPVYERSAVSGDFVCVHPDCEHDFPPEVRAEAYRFVARALA